MQRKTEKGSLGKVLGCIRMAVYNESIAEMAEKLEISPTYLNAIECEIRPCTFKILKNIFVHYVLTPEIKKINNRNFSPENVFNCAWNSGLYSTLGLPMSPKQTYDILMAECKNSQMQSQEEAKKEVIDGLKNNSISFDAVPIKFFADRKFVDSMQACIKSDLTKKIESATACPELEQHISEVCTKVSRRTTLAIKKCGQCVTTLNKMLNELTLVEPDTTYNFYKKEVL